MCIRDRALTLHKELLERENALLSENAELWEKVFMAADKGMTMQEDGKNYGDFLLDTVEAAKEQFTDKEYAWLKAVSYTHLDVYKRQGSGSWISWPFCTRFRAMIR